MILKFQQGGGLVPPPQYTITQPNLVDPFTTAESSTTKSEKDSDDMKEILDLILKADLLPNDSAYIMRQYNAIKGKVMRGYTKLDAEWGKLIYSLNQARTRKNAHDRAIEQSEKTGGLSEVGITTDGRIIGQDTETGKFKILTIDEARSGDFRILNNYELKNISAEELGYAFDNTLLEVVQNSIGMSEVNRLIKEAAMTIGTSEVQQQGYTLKMSQDMQAGLRIAQENQEGMPLSGLYKSKQITKDQTQQALLAIDYIYAALPQNAKTLLNFKTGSEQGAKELIFTRLGAQANPYKSFETDYIMDLEGNKPGTQNNADNELPDLTEVEKWLYGYGYKEQFDLVGGTSDAIRFDSTVLSMTDSGKPVGQTTLQKAIGGDFNGVLDTRSVTMGNQVIDTNALDKVILKDGRIYKVELPLNQELYRQGIIAPDYNYSKNKEKADAIIKERNITDKQQINAIYEDNNLPIKYDENGNLITTHYATFGALHAIALDQAFVDENSLAMTSYLKEIAEEREAKNALQIYKQLNGLSKDDETLKDWDYQDKPWNERSHNALYEGVLYIPVQANFANAKVGQDISPSEMDKLHRMQVETDTAKQLKRTGWNDGK